jgi:hypothetical protein
VHLVKVSLVRWFLVALVPAIGAIRARSGEET